MITGKELSDYMWLSSDFIAYLFNAKIENELNMEGPQQLTF